MGSNASFSIAENFSEKRRIAAIASIVAGFDVVLSSDAIAGMAKNADTLKSGCKPASKAVPTLPLNSCFLEWIPPSGDGKGPIFANGFIGLPARKEIPSYVIVQINQSREDEAVCLHYGGLRPPHRCTHSVYVASQD